MNKKTGFLWLIISFLLTAWTASADIPDWHKPTPCFGCHAETLGADYGDGECGNCHYYKLPEGGFNVPLLQSEHNPKICKGCHMGNTLVDGSEREIFHNGHNAVDCNKCHMVGNFTIIKPEANGFVCVSCHGNKVHSIHIAHLDKICPICHGSWAKDKVYITNTSTSSSNTSARTAVLEKFTILDLLKSLFNAILGMI
ncbi:Uncharacterised protein [uncultured archaeon]|nr:Uncharacterised protein [uncultured archaeon]